jgi:hypothetical protein
MNYQKLNEVISNLADVETTIKILTSQGKEIKIDDLKKQYDPLQHDVFQHSKRPMRSVKQPDGGFLPEDVTRIGIPMQETIVKKATSFLFGNDVELVCNTEDPNELKVLNAIKRINKDARIDSLNRTIADYLFMSTQVCEVWYSEEQEEIHNTYGFNTKIKMRVAVFSPWDGNELFPYFDEYGDLIAFSRRYQITDDEEKKILHFEVLTKDQYYIFENNPGNAGGGQWTLIRKTPNPIKKLRVVYATQDKAEWVNVNASISRLEFLLSNFGDTNDYNGSPILFSTGTINSLPGKVSTGKVIQGDVGSKMEYLSWANAPESIKLEIEKLFQIIHTYTQTPDISFDNMKSIGAISGVALELFFMDAHLKVMDKRRIFDPYLQRRLNIQKEFVIAMNNTLKDAARNMDIDCVIKPYMINDLAGKVNILMTATGGKAILSQQSAVGMSGLVDDNGAEFKIIEEETAKASLVDISEPTF